MEPTTSTLGNGLVSGTAVEPTTPLQGAIGAHQSLLLSLEDEISRLEHRLDMALGAPTPQAPGNDQNKLADPSVSLLVLAFKESNGRLQVTINKVRSLLDRLEI